MMSFAGLQICGHAKWGFCFNKTGFGCFKAVLYLFRKCLKKIWSVLQVKHNNYITERSWDQNLVTTTKEVESSPGHDIYCDMKRCSLLLSNNNCNLNVKMCKKKWWRCVLVIVWRCLRIVFFFSSSPQLFLISWHVETKMLPHVRT